MQHGTEVYVKPLRGNVCVQYTTSGRFFNHSTRMMHSSEKFTSKSHQGTVMLSSLTLDLSHLLTINSLPQILTSVFGDQYEAVIFNSTKTARDVLKQRSIILYPSRHYTMEKIELFNIIICLHQHIYNFSVTCFCSHRCFPPYRENLGLHLRVFYLQQ